MRSARSPVNLIGSPINYADRLIRSSISYANSLIGSPITSQSTDLHVPVAGEGAEADVLGRLLALLVDQLLLLLLRAGIEGNRRLDEVQGLESA